MRGFGCSHYAGIVLASIGRNVRLQIRPNREIARQICRSLRRARENIRQGDVANLNILVCPLVEQLDGADLLGDILWENSKGDGGVDLDFAFRHIDREPGLVDLWVIRSGVECCGGYRATGCRDSGVEVGRRFPVRGAWRLA